MPHCLHLVVDVDAGEYGGTIGQAGSGVLARDGGCGHQPQAIVATHTVNNGVVPRIRGLLAVAFRQYRH